MDCELTALKEVVFIKVNAPLEAVAHLSPVASALSATNSGTISEDCARGDYSRINTIVPRQRTIPRLGSFLLWIRYQ